MLICCSKGLDIRLHRPLRHFGAQEGHRAAAVGHGDRVVGPQIGDAHVVAVLQAKHAVAAGRSLEHAETGNQGS